MSIPPRFTIQWHLTHACNLRCRHCYQEDYSGASPDLKQLLAILDQFGALREASRRAAGLGPVRFHLTLTGGEPFLREDIFELLTHVVKQGFSFSILTNATLIDNSLARRLKALKPAYVQVSLEGGQSTNDHIRGPGAYQRTLKALRILGRHRIPTLISFTAHRGNFREFKQVCRTGIRLGVRRVWVDRFVPFGSGAHMADEVLSPLETRELFEIMAFEQKRARRGIRPKTHIAMHRALQFLVGGGRPYACSAGAQLLAVMPEGDVYPCRRMPIRLGNLNQHCLTDMYAHNDVLKRLRNPECIPAECADCFYKRLCRGGLRCLAHAVTNDPFSVDPGCWRHQQTRSTAVY